MNRTVPVLAAILALSASFALAQASKPVAYIYVSSNYSGSNNRVVGYAAAADGTLTKISGSPWADNLSYLATTGSYLFGSTNIATDNGKNIFSYKVESNGALKFIGATNIQDDGSENACNFAENLTLDHSGSYLFAYVQGGNGCNSDGYGAYQSFAINKSTGLLNYLNVTGTFPPGNFVPLTMLADNNYAFTAGIYAGGVDGLKKTSNGSLEILSSSSPAVGTEGMPSGWGYDYGNTAADPTNHLAVDVCFASDGGAYGCDDTEDKIATFTINTSNGAQSTSSTFSNMTTTDVQYVDALAMAPGGKLLAVAGRNGVQIFNFNPNGQATQNTGLISTAPIPSAYAGSPLYWDNHNHLYFISNADNALHVFTVTATSAVEAPGSPYSIPGPVALTGHSL
jgi:hypothetical protein